MDILPIELKKKVSRYLSYLSLALLNLGFAGSFVLSLRYFNQPIPIGWLDILHQWWGTATLFLFLGLGVRLWYKVSFGSILLVALSLQLVLLNIAHYTGFFVLYQGILPFLIYEPLHYMIAPRTFLLAIVIVLCGWLLWIRWQRRSTRLPIAPTLQPVAIAKDAPSKPRPKPKVEKKYGFVLPDYDLLSLPKKSKFNYRSPESSYQLRRVLEEFGVKGDIGDIHTGPVVTLYELHPAPGIKSARVIGLASDIARSMSALSARIAVIPGKNVIGIELPNKIRETVYFRELLETKEFQEASEGLMLALGQNILGHPVMVDLAKMPHLLIAGTTGSGKSVSVNAMILSLLYRLSPTQCRMLMIDPKMLELSVYDGIPHLMAPVVTDAKRAVNVLKWAVQEMEQRYAKMSKLGVRNINNYNQRLKEAQAKGEILNHRVQTGFDEESGRPIYENSTISYEFLPYIVVIVDEMADLMLVAGKDIEICVQRLAQMARAAGIHLIMATQRPSVDVITGTIKANFPTRISFHVTSKIDSRTILGEQGAEQLLGQGDMLYMKSGGKIERVHGPFVSDEEVERVVGHLKLQERPEGCVFLDLDAFTPLEDNASSDAPDGCDPLFNEAVALITREGKASISLIQQRMKIGYNRSARIMGEMEEKGIVSPPDHTGKRKIIG